MVFLRTLMLTLLLFYRQIAPILHLISKKEIETACFISKKEIEY